MRSLVKFCERQQWRPRLCNVCGVHGSGPPFAVLLLLAGCSLGPVIAENTIDYNTTVETVTNSVLVTNILRARDGAPLYFSDLSQIRGSLQLNLSAQTTVPYGAIYSSTTAATVQPGPFTVSTQPGFDVAPLNTKKFAEGMLAGIDVKQFGFFLARGIDYELLLNLVVSRVDIYYGTEVKDDKDGDAGNNGKHLDYRLVESCTPFQAKCPLPRLIRSWTYAAQGPTIGTVSDTANLGPPIPTEAFVHDKGALADLIKADAANLDFDKVSDKDTKSEAAINCKKEAGSCYQLSKKTEAYVLCAGSRPGLYEAIGIAPIGAAKEPKAPPIPKSNGTCSKAKPRPQRYVMYTRSVEAIFYYLGYLAEHPQASPFKFYIYDHPVEDIRFRTNYRGRSYYIREPSGDDYTVTVLAILNDLLNLNRDADEIPSTKTVATTP